ncbi:MAG TPA: TonB-dependent receptor, partial [Rhizomicrobium sp.]|nr:TonB-dependent receptor [Rhizomicrobium sp.]
MLKLQSIRSFLVTTVCASALFTGAIAADFNIPQGDLNTALSTYAQQTGTSLVYVVSTVQGIQTRGVQGNLSPDAALVRILSGTGFIVRRFPSGAIGIDREQRSSNQTNFEFAQAAPAPRSVETVTVTSSKLGGADVQSIPISITALSQEQLTATQTSGGPDLVKQVPNLTFTKTNFSGYSINIRGIGTQAISVTTDPAVAIALNDIPFIRNHFFEQEFYDLAQLEVLRGPQGTLYGRNATAGVVNLTTAKPTDQFEAMASGEIGN